MIGRTFLPAALASFSLIFSGAPNTFAAPPIHAAGPYRYLIPAAANAAGLGGSRWQTEATLKNPGTEPAVVNLYLLERDRDNTGASGASVSIAAGASLYLGDLIAEVFEREDTTGAVLVGADQPILVESRTFSSGPDGTFGQRIPGSRVQTPRISDGGHLVLAMATENERFRTNFGIANGGAEAVSVATTFFDSRGGLLTTRTDMIPPWGAVQVNRVLAGVGPIDDSWAVFSTIPGGAPVTVYTSVVDNLSHDPVFSPASPMVAEASWVVAAAHTGGINSTTWRTDLVIVNPTTETAAYALELLPSDTDNSAPTSASFELGPGGLVRHQDVVGQVFDFSGVGALRVVPSSGSVVVASRTFTETGAGTVGQFIPGVPASSAADPAATGHLIHLSSSATPGSGSRTNIGFANPGGTPMTLSTRVVSAEGALLQSFTTTVNALGHTQERLSAHVPDDDRRGMSAMVSATGPNDRFFAYASVVDNRSGDPIFLPATAPAVLTEPLQAGFGWQPDTITAGQEVAFEDRSTGQPDGWSWDFGDGSTAAAQNPSHIFASAGTYSVTLEVTRAGEVSNAEESITILPRPLLAPCGTISTDWPQVVTWAINADLDGLVDLVVTSNRSSPDTVKVLHNDGNLGFSEVFAAHVPGGGLTEAAVADFDGDGLDDFALTVNNDGTDPPGVVFFENLGDGEFTAHPTGAPLIDPLELTVVDVDGDLDLDLIVPDFDVGYRVYTNLGDFSFSEKRVAKICEFLAFGDLTGDGRVDMACGDVAELAVVLDVEGGATQIPAITITDGNFRTLRIRDLDGDGRHEILASVFVGEDSGAHSGRLDIFEVEGAGVSRTWSSQVYLGYPFGVQVCDIDDNGTRDLLFSCGGVHAESADGPGFTAAGLATNLEQYDRFVCTDLDLDGSVELVTGCRCDLQVLCR
jgi:PKD repeat protein